MKHDLDCLKTMTHDCKQHLKRGILMTKLSRQKGFTLVELAIVLTIIGLLIGGILKGQQLMTNARITSTLAQVNAVEAAATTFRDTYGNLPGDLPQANLRVSGWANTSAMASLGDGIVGITNWDLLASQSANVPNPAALPATETLMFWGQLGSAGLLSGVNWNGAAMTTAAAYGAHAPAARIRGGFLVGFADGTRATPRSTALAAGLAVNPSGLQLIVAPAPAALVTTTGSQALSPSIAAQMDRKMDDGNPGTGNVQAYGFFQASTTLGCANTATGIYNEASVTARDCGLFFEIQG
jgi:prepilin-type N-terminal cleavage/methylation domain-containing protein